MSNEINHKAWLDSGIGKDMTIVVYEGRSVFSAPQTTNIG